MIVRARYEAVMRMRGAVCVPRCAIHALPACALMLCASLLCVPTHRGLHAQTVHTDSLIRVAVAGTPSPIAPLDLLLPTALRAGYAARTWVRDSLASADVALDDLDRMDLIYARALGESEGEIGTALFAALVASFEHRTIPLAFGPRVPLTLESEEDFARRVAALPGHLFADRPGGGDRDKLQHFFASAWLAWGLDNAELADAIGLAVEAGEAAFVSGGADDPRDVRANRLGQLYAELLRRRPGALPSVMFRAWNKRWEGAR